MSVAHKRTVFYYNNEFIYIVETDEYFLLDAEKNWMVLDNNYLDVHLCNKVRNAYERYKKRGGGR